MNTLPLSDYIKKNYGSNTKLAEAMGQNSEYRKVLSEMCKKGYVVDTDTKQVYSPRPLELPEPTQL